MVEWSIEFKTIELEPWKPHVFVAEMSKTELQIIETVHGTYSFHLSLKGDMRPLCGSEITMMPTEIPLETWGLKTHLGEKYCSICSNELYLTL